MLFIAYFEKAVVQLMRLKEEIAKKRKHMKKKQVVARFGLQRLLTVDTSQKLLAGERFRSNEKVKAET